MAKPVSSFATRNNSPSVLCYGYVRGLTPADGDELIERGVIQQIVSGQPQLPGEFHGPRVGFFSGLAHILEEGQVSLTFDITRLPHIAAMADGLVPCHKEDPIAPGHHRICMGVIDKDGHTDYHFGIKVNGAYYHKMGEKPATIVQRDPEAFGTIAGYTDVRYYDCPIDRPDFEDIGHVATVTNPEVRKAMTDELDYVVGMLELVHISDPDQLNTTAAQLLGFAVQNSIEPGPKLAHYAPKNPGRSAKAAPTKRTDAVLAIGETIA